MPKHGFVRIEGQPELDLNNIALLAQQWGIRTIQTWLNSTGVPSFRSAAIPTAFVRTREPDSGSPESSVAAPTFLTISEIRDQPVVIKNPQRSAAHLMFYPECNDPYPNRYNRTMSLRRLANTDITPRTSLQALLNHLSEYCTKAGLMNKLIAERNYSGHEIAHMLFSPRLVNISRTVIPSTANLPYNKTNPSPSGVKSV
ncbi:hypothetical protein D6C91_10471 [Aureobasidium pullulans]|uniref:Uncharacterized protein n=1 Tax=Aureobasidium pullulans TaxID=5580 RepID=A0A4S9S5N3_AURPU|nr:hypothetical protein D6C91_10471 [Aureobasidium pullulans]